MYRTAAASTEQALECADNYLSMFLHWSDSASGEDYDLDDATVTEVGFDTETRRPLYEVRVPVTYTDRSDPDLIHLLDGISDAT